MKNKLLKNIFVLSLLFLAPIFLIACKDDDKDKDNDEGEDIITITNYSITGYKETFFVNENFTINGAKLNLELSNNETEIINITSTMLKDSPDLTSAGTKTVTIIYDEVEYSFSITVKVAQVVSINIHNGIKTEYLTTDTKFDITNGKILVKYEDDTSKIIDIEEYMLPTFNNTKGHHQAVVTYAQKTTSFNYEVKQETTNVKIDKIELYAENWHYENFTLTSVKFEINNNKYSLEDTNDFEDFKFWDYANKNISFDLTELLFDKLKCSIDIELQDNFEYTFLGEYELNENVTAEKVNFKQNNSQYYVEQNLLFEIEALYNFGDEQEFTIIELPFTIKIYLNVK